MDWGEHQWGQSWRDRPPARCPPALLCVIAAQGHCVIATQGPRVWWLGPEPQGSPSHQMGRHPTIWDIGTEVLPRISARKSPWVSRPLNRSFVQPPWTPKCKHVYLYTVLKFGPPHRVAFGSPYGSHEAHRPPWGPRNPPGPKGPQVTAFCHQMDRHPTIWDMETGTLRRIPARISPWWSRGLNPNFSQ